MDELLLGIDVGTSGLKALLINTKGSVIASATSEYRTMSPKYLWSEQNPEDWWSACCDSIWEVLTKSNSTVEQVCGIGLTGQMHGLVLLNADGEVLRPCILWNDQRTALQCERINKKIGHEKLLQITGNPVLAGFTAPKILWVREEEPEIYTQIKHILLPKDYIRYRLSGEFATDLSDASGTSLLDVGCRTWAEEIIQNLGLSKEWLPTLYESIEMTGKVSSKAAESTGLLPGIPIFAGAGDQAAGAVGCGAVEPGVISVVLGTSGVIFAPSGRWSYEKEGRLHAFCHAVPGTWHFMGVTLSAAGSLRWYRDIFCHPEIEEAHRKRTDVYDLILKKAMNVPAGSDGLLFLPYISGERTPWPDPYARGVFFGITGRHTKDHFTRAILEGVAYSLKDCLELLKYVNLPIEEIRVTGGGSKSHLWRQILSNVFNTEIKTVSSADSAPYGAALLAGVGCGIFKNVKEACNEAIKITSNIEPAKPDVKLYNSFYQIFRDMYPTLKRLFNQTSMILN